MELQQRIEQKQKSWFNMIASELGSPVHSVANCFTLLEEGNTTVFIARYRKEQTGALDEVQVGLVGERMAQFKEFEKRREAIKDSLTKRELLSVQLEREIDGAATLSELEDIYLPHRPKRVTRASMARDKGLESLAQSMFKGVAVNLLAATFVDVDRGVENVDEAIAGARDIVAEWISEDKRNRAVLRTLFRKEGIARSTVIAKKREEATKFRDYFDWSEPVARLAGHRVLALFRGESQKLLKLSFLPDEASALAQLQRYYSCDPEGHIGAALQDGYHRLLAPAMEKELRKELKERADGEAIDVFAENLRALLLAPPLGQKRVLALDPGFASGAKLSCLDEQGGLLHHETIYPTQGREREMRAGERIRELIDRYQVQAIAIGSGTAGRETEQFVRGLGLGDPLIITLVNEDGASIYSASETARREFPDHDITVRGSVSIGRRLQDPLAELVKIAPKSLGVGQYQHDVDQKLLQQRLDEVVVSCVNKVGVELNSASAELLTHVSGLGAVLARNIIDWRSENGPFRHRHELLKVPRLGAKVFEQCAGFLRIRNSTHPLDNTGVHPERYELVATMARDRGLLLDAFIEAVRKGAQIDLARYIKGDVGRETLTDIMAELVSPGRDPREMFEPFAFAEKIQKIEDLEVGMVLPAIITNVTKFGAFADLGIKQDGLIHISQMADRFVKDPAEVVQVRQQLKVRVVEIDIARGRIGLSLKKVS